MEYILVGSRARGDYKSASDWDVMIREDTPKEVSTSPAGNEIGGHGPPPPSWGQARMSCEEIATHKATIRIELGIPLEGTIDTFVGAYCPDRGLYAVLHEDGFAVGMASSMEGAEKVARDGWGY